MAGERGLELGVDLTLACVEGGDRDDLPDRGRFLLLPGLLEVGIAKEEIDEMRLDEPEAKVAADCGIGDHIKEGIPDRQAEVLIEVAQSSAEVRVSRSRDLQMTGAKATADFDRENLVLLNSLGVGDAIALCLSNARTQAPDPMTVKLVSRSISERDHPAPRSRVSPGRASSTLITSPVRQVFQVSVQAASPCGSSLSSSSR